MALDVYEEHVAVAFKAQSSTEFYIYIYMNIHIYLRCLIFFNIFNVLETSNYTFQTSCIPYITRTLQLSQAEISRLNTATQYSNAR